MEIKIESAEGAVVVRPMGSLTTATTPLLHGRLAEFMDAGARDIALDASKMVFIDSAGIGLVIALHTRMLKHGRKFKLFGVRPSVAESFRIVGILDLLGIYESEAEALEG